ncbi:MAG: squalene/phytoene synthase family protein [Candidatus Zixiibacteriota bacterium]|nr:MAG: squalene/phytoene synthase family protein [candidate division Zixibacteria bacterium]
MKDTTAVLARSITWAGSKQTYYTARLLVDKDLVNDFYRAYAYFRWVDDIVDADPSRDAPGSNDIPSLSDDDRIAFVRRQKELINRLYRSERPDDLVPEEEIIADLISHDRGENSGLQSFIRNMFAIIEFDAYRRGRLISQQELTWYTDYLGKSVTDGLLYFIGNGHPYLTTNNRYLAAEAAHIAHLLRDMLPDTADGFVNIPREYLEAHDISPEDVNSPAFRGWVQYRVEQARDNFREGKRYLDELDVLRCKIVGYWYCTRFEGVLDTVERDGYTLRAEYNERRNLSTWLKIAWLGVSVTLRHIAHQRFRDS